MPRRKPVVSSPEATPAKSASNAVRSNDGGGPSKEMRQTCVPSVPPPLPPSPPPCSTCRSAPTTWQPCLRMASDTDPSMPEAGPDPPRDTSSREPCLCNGGGLGMSASGGGWERRAATNSRGTDLLMMPTTCTGSISIYSRVL